LRKEAVVNATCWELKSQLFKALVLPTFTYGIEIWGGNLKNSHWKVFEKGMKMYMMSHIKVCPSTTYHILLVEFREPPIELSTLKLIMGFQQQLTHLSPFGLVSKEALLSQHLAKQEFNTWYKSATIYIPPP
jgi:hypothetical protein